MPHVMVPCSAAMMCMMGSAPVGSALGADAVEGFHRGFVSAFAAHWQSRPCLGWFANMFGKPIALHFSGASHAVHRATHQMMPFCWLAMSVSGRTHAFHLVLFQVHAVLGRRMHVNRSCIGIIRMTRRATSAVSGHVFAADRPRVGIRTAGSCSSAFSHGRVMRAMMMPASATQGSVAAFPCTVHQHMRIACKGTGGYHTQILICRRRRRHSLFCCKSIKILLRCVDTGSKSCHRH